MATYDLQEQEQIAELKTWWSMHGSAVATLAATIALGSLTWQGWQWWQRSEMTTTGKAYGALLLAAEKQDVKKVRQLVGDLLNNNSGSAYAGMGAMVAGSVFVAANDLKSAEAQFSWAQEHARHKGLRQVSRLREAMVLAEDRQYDAALQVLDAAPPPAQLAARFDELRGDIHVASGDFSKGAAAYAAALQAAEAQSGQGLQVQQAAAFADILRDKHDAAKALGDAS